jgi:hypothetical protein
LGQGFHAEGEDQASSFLLNPSFVLCTNQKVLSPLRETNVAILNPPPRPLIRLYAFYYLIVPLFHVGFQTLKHHSHLIDVVFCFRLNYYKHSLATIGVMVLELGILEDCLIQRRYHHSSLQQTSPPYWVLSNVGNLVILETHQLQVLGGFLIFNFIFILFL